MMPLVSHAPRPQMCFRLRAKGRTAARYPCGSRGRHRIAKADENIIAVRLDRKTFRLTVEARGQFAQVVPKVIADFLLIGRDRFDID